MLMKPKAAHRVRPAKFHFVLRWLVPPGRFRGPADPGVLRSLSGRREQARRGQSGAVWQLSATVGPLRLGEQGQQAACTSQQVPCGKQQSWIPGSGTRTQRARSLLTSEGRAARRPRGETALGPERAPSRRRGKRAISAGGRIGNFFWSFLLLQHTAFALAQPLGLFVHPW